MLVKLKYLFKERVEFTKNTSIPCYSVTKKGIIPQLDTIAKTRKIENRKIIYPNDYIFNSRSSRFGSSGLASSIGSVASVNLVIYPISSLITMDYMKYYFKSPLFIYQFYFLGKGIVDDLWSTHYEQLKELVLILPPLNQQIKKSSILTLKYSLIQELFQKIDLLLKKLEDYQTSLINEQVIQNNPSINYIKFKYLFKERNELTLDTLTYPCFSVSRIIGIIPLGKNVTKTRIPLKRKIIYPNDLVLKARSWGDHHYASALSSVTGSLSSVYFVFYSISNIINLKYMDYLFQSVFFKYQFLLLGKGIGDLTWSTHYNQLKELKWNFPSLLHQNEIVSFLTPKLEALSKLKHHYTSLKVLLEEYQQSLLYETFQNLL